jgi:hypothetical protein
LNIIAALIVAVALVMSASYIRPLSAVDQCERLVKALQKPELLEPCLYHAVARGAP